MKNSLTLLALCFCLLSPLSSRADGYSIMTWPLPGSGQSPSFADLLKIGSVAAKANRHRVSTGSKGDVTHAVPIGLPPALLSPQIEITYNSSIKFDLEMSYGWTLNGPLKVDIPVARAFASTDLLVSGEIQGVLVQDETDTEHYTLKTSAGGLVTARYVKHEDREDDELEIYLDGTTYTLAYQTGAASYRVTQARDQFGNTVSYSYDSGRLDQIEYGGNPDTGDSHNVRLQFVYEENEYNRSSYYGTEDGEKISYSHRLTEIVIFTKNGSGAWRRQNAYVFTYVLSDSIELLSRIVFQGASTRDGMQILGNFGYTAYSATAAAERVSTDIFSGYLQTSQIKGDEDVTEGLTGTTHVKNMLADVTGDGLVDYLGIDAADGGWLAYSQDVNPSTREFSFNDFPGELELYESNGFVEVELESGLKHADRPKYVYIKKQLTDIDGDGLSDYVVASDTDGSVTVYYGTGGEFAVSATEPAPEGWTYLQKGYAPDAESFPDFGVGTLSAMIDINGDGWLDLVDTETGSVYFHNGSRGAGWLSVAKEMNRDFAGYQMIDNTVGSSVITLDLGAIVSECDEACETFNDECIEEGTSESEDECYEICSGKGKCAKDDECMDECMAGCMEDMEETAIYDCNEDLETCLDDCSTMESVSETIKYVQYQNDVARFYDINGDGLADYVDARTMPWRVYLGRGNGDFSLAQSWPAPYAYLERSDEGLPNISWEARYDTAEDSGEIEGTPARILAKLVDVDADGLDDWAGADDYGRVWYKNTGVGFESSPRELPLWWPSSFSESETETEYKMSLDESYSSIDTQTNLVASLMDIDHDGAQDRVESTGITYGNYPPPHLLNYVSSASGGETSINYRCSSSIDQSYDSEISWRMASAQHMPISKHLVDFVETSDSVTSQTGKTAYDFADGYFVDGIFRGFEEQQVIVYVNDTQVSKAINEYELGVYHAPLPTKTWVYTDTALSFGDEIARSSTPSFGVRYYTETTYDDFNGSRLIKSKSVTEYGETSGTSKTFTLTYDWDDHGNLSTFWHDGGGVLADSYQVAFTYGADVTGKFYRMLSRELSGHDPLNADGYRAFAATAFFYDGADTSDATTISNGLLTTVRVSAGWHDGGEDLDDVFEWYNYEYGDRGEMTKSTDVSTGKFVSQTYTFNDSVIASQTNSLSHVQVYGVNERGQIKSVTDPNGVVHSVSLDSFGRPLSNTVTDATGAVHTVGKRSYSTAAVPNYIANHVYKDDGSVESSNYTVLNGMGDAVKTWNQSADGGYLVTDSLYDVQGNLIKNEHPKSSRSLFSATASVRIDETLLWNCYDGLGEIREIKSDATKDLGSYQVYFNEPWRELRVDAEDYKTLLTYDAHHRIINVAQGRYNELVTTAEDYRYDPQHRLVKYTDPNDKVYTYSYDGAGRLRQTSYGTATTPMTSWYTYFYKGNLMTHMEDNTGGYSDWEYDNLGRATRQIVSDGLPTSISGILSYSTSDSEPSYSWTYDTKWIGALSSSSDPSGETEYEYDSMGRVSSTERSYITGGVTATFTSEFDIQGRPKTIAFPSGHTIQSSYANGWLSKLTGTGGGLSDYQISYAYNRWGKLQQATSSLGQTFSYKYTTPHYLDSLQFKPSRLSRAQSFSYSWHKNGLLRGRSIVGSPGTTFTYDELKQLIQLNRGTTVVESYDYDAAGAIESMQDSAGLRWDYSTAGGVMGQITSRTALGYYADNYDYDSAGRLSVHDSVNTSGSHSRQYFYDGLGRVRAIMQDGECIEVLDYDAQGNLVRRANGDPFTMSPAFTYSFGDWEYDGSTVTENYTNFVSAQNGNRVWKMKDYDGHVAVTASDSGMIDGTRALGAYGKELEVIGTAWDKEAFHGNQKDTITNDLYRVGQRNLMIKDGQWLQPEPMMYSGINPSYLADPLTFSTYRFGRNSPGGYTDPSGRYIESFIDLASLGVGLHSIANWDESTRFGSKLLDVGGVAADLTALALPGIPGGASMLVRGSRYTFGKYGKAHRMAMSIQGSISNIRGNIFEEFVLHMDGLTKYTGAKLSGMGGKRIVNFVPESIDYARGILSEVKSSKHVGGGRREVNQILAEIDYAVRNNLTYELTVRSGAKISNRIKSAVENAGGAIHYVDKSWWRNYVPDGHLRAANAVDAIESTPAKEE